MLEDTEVAGADGEEVEPLPINVEEVLLAL
jgi:hypothetical protein